MKKIIKNNMGYIIVGVLLLAFLGVVLINGAGKETMNSKEVTQWLEATKKDEYSVTVIAQTTCSHCIAYKPLVEEAKAQYNFNLYWFEVDTLRANNPKDYNVLINTYELDEYGGTPYTFITKNSKVIAHLSGRTENTEEFVEFLKQHGVISQ